MGIGTDANELLQYHHSAGTESVTSSVTLKSVAIKVEANDQSRTRLGPAYRSNNRVTDVDGRARAESCVVTLRVATWTGRMGQRHMSNTDTDTALVCPRWCWVRRRLLAAAWLFFLAALFLAQAAARVRVAAIPGGWLVAGCEEELLHPIPMANACLSKYLRHTILMSLSFSFGAVSLLLFILLQFTWLKRKPLGQSGDYRLIIWLLHRYRYLHICSASLSLESGNNNGSSTSPRMCFLQLPFERRLRRS